MAASTTQCLAAPHALSAGTLRCGRWAGTRRWPRPRRGAGGARHGHHDRLRAEQGRLPAPGVPVDL